MSTQGMDPEHLKPDELEYELQLRHLKPDDPDWAEKFNSRILSEQSGEIDTPLDVGRLTRLSTTKELRDCELKFTDIANEINKSVQQADDELADQCQSRLVHIAGRVLRLHLYAPDHAAVRRLHDRIRVMRGELILARDSLGAGEQGASIPQANLASLELWGTSESTAGGAIRKTSGRMPCRSPPSDPVPPRSERPSVVTQPNAPTVDPFAWPRGSIDDLFRSSQPHYELASNVRNFFEDPAIVESFPQASKAPGSNRPPIQRNFPESNHHRPVHADQGNFGMTGGHRIHHWSLRFSGVGGLDVEDFLFRVEHQARLYGVAPGALCIGIGNLLTGKALQWYWTYQRDHGVGTWQELKEAFLSRYAPNQETDYEIRSKIENRYQTEKESFNDFCQDVEALAVKLTHRMRQEELVEVLKRNMSTTLRRALWRERVRSVDDLLRLCGQYERMCREDEKIAMRRKQVHVNEVVREEQYDRSCNPPIPSTYLEPPPARIEAMRTPTTNRNDLSLCWNCHDIGHVFSQCPHPQMAVFCFTCGTRGVITVTCPKCSGNLQRGQQPVGTARPAFQPSMMQRPPPQIPPPRPHRQSGPENAASH